MVVVAPKDYNATFAARAVIGRDDLLDQFLNLLKALLIYTAQYGPVGIRHVIYFLI